MSNLHTPYQRPLAGKLAERLAETRRFIQVVAGPRQVGKSTLVQHVVKTSSLPVVYASAEINRIFWLLALPEGCNR